MKRLNCGVDSPMGLNSVLSTQLAPFLGPRWQLCLTPCQFQHKLNCLISFPPKHHHNKHIDIFAVSFNSRFLLSRGRMTSHFTQYLYVHKSPLDTTSPNLPLTPSHKTRPSPTIFPHQAGVRGSFAEWLQLRFWSQERGFKNLAPLLSGFTASAMSPF